MLLNLIAKEPSLADIILKNSNVSMLINLNGTCKIFNEMTKDEVRQHYIESTKIQIPKRFELLVKKRMFDTCTEEEYDVEALALSKMITDDNYKDVVDALTSEYYFYMFEAVRSSGLQKDMYSSLYRKYLAFLLNINAILGDGSEEEDDNDW